MEDLRSEPPLPVSLTSPRKFIDRKWLHVTLFVLTALSTTLVGAGHYAGYLSDFGRQPVTMAFPEIVLHGFWYSGTILFILGAHEFGHYLACRYYQVDASLPFFIPLPLPPTGTMGAVIKIREPFPNKVVLFDVGVAGPLAGFAVALPALFLGVAMSPVTRLPSSLQGGLELGEPLLFQAAAWLIWGSIADGYSLNLHPLAFAAWFGLIATSFNLFPFSQLDGGHISYAVLGPRSTAVTIGSVVVAVGLAFISSNWVVWTVLMVAVMVVMGPRHPRTLDEDTPLDRPRLWLALLAVVIFALCFTPNPMEPTDLFASR